MQPWSEEAKHTKRHLQSGHCHEPDVGGATEVLLICHESFKHPDSTETDSAYTGIILSVLLEKESWPSCSTCISLIRGAWEVLLATLPDPEHETTAQAQGNNTLCTTLIVQGSHVTIAPMCQFMLQIKMLEPHFVVKTVRKLTNNKNWKRVYQHDNFRSKPSC